MGQGGGSGRVEHGRISCGSDGWDKTTAAGQRPAAADDGTVDGEWMKDVRYRTAMGSRPGNAGDEHGSPRRSRDDARNEPGRVWGCRLGTAGAVGKTPRGIAAPGSGVRHPPEGDCASTMTDHHHGCRKQCGRRTYRILRQVAPVVTAGGRCDDRGCGMALRGGSAWVSKKLEDQISSDKAVSRWPHASANCCKLRVFTKYEG